MGKPKCGLLAIVAMAVLLAAPAGAQSGLAEDTTFSTPAFCASVEAVSAANRAHGYAPVGDAAMVDARNVLQRWAAPDGSWLLMLVRADSAACDIAAGSMWQGEPAGPGKDS